jgi:hypothetical protein
MDNPAGYETPLQMAVRHVAEGRDRLRRHRGLIEKLEREGYERLLPQARQILANMERLQKEFEAHVVDQQRRGPRSD